jgi:hypothetical protein
MDDVTLMATLDSGETIYVSPVHEQTYAEYVEADNLGGPQGYFISLERRGQFEVLAKATNLASAEVMFALFTSGRKLV